MSANVTVTGNIAEPRVKTTQSGKTVCELSIAGTHSQKNKQTGQWEDTGAPLWLRAAFWDDEAQALGALPKGARVSVSGTLTIRQYTDSSGMARESLELLYPRFLGVIPKKGQHVSHPPVGQASFVQPAEDPWATPAQDHFPISQGAPAVSEPPF